MSCTYSGKAGNPTCTAHPLEAVSPSRSANSTHRAHSTASLPCRALMAFSSGSGTCSQQPAATTKGTQRRLSSSNTSTCPESRMLGTSQQHHAALTQPRSRPTAKGAAMGNAEHRTRGATEPHGTHAIGTNPRLHLPSIGRFLTWVSNALSTELPFLGGGPSPALSCPLGDLRGIWLE